MTNWNSNYNQTLPFTVDTARFALAANTAQTYTVPGATAQKYTMDIEFNSTANIFIGYNVTATVPGAGTSETTQNIEYRPRKPRYVKAGDVISVITPDTTAYVGLSLLAIPG